MAREAATQECSRTVGLIYPFLDRELDDDADAAVRAHLGVCAVCRDVVAAEEAFLSLVRTDIRPAPAPTITVSLSDAAMCDAGEATTARVPRRTLEPRVCEGGRPLDEGLLQP